jgi:hypothetical protein
VIPFSPFPSGERRVKMGMMRTCIVMDEEMDGSKGLSVEPLPLFPFENV